MGAALETSRHEDIGIKVRNPKWDYSDIDSLASLGQFGRLMWSTLSLVFPEGERFFIRSVKRFQDQVSDPVLQKEIKAFIAQETQHGRMHEMYNDQFILKRSPDEIVNRGPRSARFQAFENFLVNYISPKLPLAMTAAAEHYTAAWAGVAFDDDRVKKMPQSLKYLIYWHAIEEVEHKHVAYNVLKSADGSYFTRAAGMVVQSVMMGTNLPLLFLELLAHEEHVDWPKLFGDIVHEATDKNGLIRKFVEAFWEYMRPDFDVNANANDRWRAAQITEELESFMKIA